MARNKTGLGSALVSAARKAKSLEAWRVHGTARAAAKHIGAREKTVGDWLRQDPAYRERVKEAVDEYALTIGQMGHNAIAQHIEDALAGRMVVTKDGIESGKKVCLKERVMLNPSLVRLALTRADPRFTHPKQEVDMTTTMGERAVQELLREGSERQGQPAVLKLAKMAEDSSPRAVK